MKFIIFIIALIIPQYAITPLAPAHKLHVYVTGPKNLEFEDIQYWHKLKKKSVTENNFKLFEIANPTEPFQIIHQTLKLKGKIVFDQDYIIGEFGFRNSPSTLSDLRRHIIIAGDSNTFGLGVNPEYTPSYLVANKLKNYVPYNYGIRGGGPHNTLAIMEFFPWKKEIEEPNGIFIYNYYDILLDRVIGAKNYVKWSHAKAPWYKLENNQVLFKGTFQDSLLIKFYLKIAEIKWLDKLLPVLPRYGHEHTELLAQIFLKMQKNYYTNFPYGHFYIAINYNIDESEVGRLEELAQELKKNNISYFKIPKIINENADLFVDGHLNNLGHEKEASQLYQELKKHNI